MKSQEAWMSRVDTRPLSLTRNRCTYHAIQEATKEEEGCVGKIPALLVATASPVTEQDC
jgi:hypothetical protein